MFTMSDAAPRAVECCGSEDSDPADIGIAGGLMSRTAIVLCFVGFVIMLAVAVYRGTMTPGFWGAHQVEGGAVTHTEGWLGRS